MSSESERQANRERFPSLARIVDEMRLHFPGAQVTAIRTMSDEKKKMLADYAQRHRASEAGPQKR